MIRKNARGLRLAHAAVAGLAVLGGIGLPACSSQQLYGTGQAWQRQECNKIIDAQERGRCLASASTSYDEYRRQSEAAKGAK